MSRFQTDRYSVFFVLSELTGAALLIAIVLTARGAAFGDEPVTRSDAPTAWLKVGDAAAGTGDFANRNPAEYEQYRKTQAERIKSPSVLQGVLRKEGIADLPLLHEQQEPLQWLQKHVFVICPLESELLQIRVPGEDSKQAAKIVNAVIESYLENIADVERMQQLRQREIVDQALQERKQEMLGKLDIINKLERDFSSGSSAQELGRERYLGLVRLQTDVRQRRLEIDLQTAAAKVRLAQSAENSPEAAKAKLDLAVADAQREVLERAAEEFSKALSEAAADANAAAHPSAGLESLRTDIKDLQAVQHRLTMQREKLNMQLAMPPRVIVLERATSPD